MFEKFTKNIKDFFGEGSELSESIKMAVEERITSPFYGYFIVSWIIVNWQLLYAAFFLDQDLIFKKTGLLRVEYFNTLFPTSGSWNFFLYFLIEPAAVTFLVFWVLPFVTRIFYRKSIRNQKALRIIELQESKKETKEQKKLISEETSLIREEVKKAREEKTAAREAPEVLWEREFKEFQKTNIYQKFNQIVETIYEHRGYIRYGDFVIDTDILLYADARELIVIDQTQAPQITLTTKGRFFTRRFSEIQSKEIP